MNETIAERPLNIIIKPINMQEILHEHILPHIASFIGALLTGFAGFIFGRKKQNAEVESIEVNNDSVEIANVTKIAEVYKNTLDDLGLRYEKKFNEIISLYEQKVQLLHDEINLQKRIIEHLKEENKMLHKKLKDNGIS